MHILGLRRNATGPYFCVACEAMSTVFDSKKHVSVMMKQMIMKQTGFILS